MLIGKSSAKIDRRGWVRIPYEFRKDIVEKYGNEVFVTIIDGEHVRIYPMKEWSKFSIDFEVVRKNPRMRKFLLYINRNGNITEIDWKGRILINKQLREKFDLKGSLTIEMKENHM